MSGPPEAGAGRAGADVPRAGVHVEAMRRARRSLVVACCVWTALACAGPGGEARAYQDQVQPPGPPPGGVPPPPPSTGEVPSGQWVYTQQYGWVWMTYGDEYTYVPPGGTGEPLEYVYYGDYGWTWLAAPWVWGIGPRPFFGRPGPRPFAWYQHGYWRSPQRWRYRPPPARDEVTRRGVRPAPQRSGRRPAAPERREERRGGEQRGGGEERRGGEQRGDGGGRARPFEPGAGREGR